jgi:hypothetical protein
MKLMVGKDTVSITLKSASVIKVIKIKFRICHTMFAASAGALMFHHPNITCYVSFMGENTDATMMVINEPPKKQE